METKLLRWPLSHIFKPHVSHGLSLSVTNQQNYGTAGVCNGWDMLFHIKRCLICLAGTIASMKIVHCFSPLIITSEFSKVNSVTASGTKHSISMSGRKPSPAKLPNYLLILFLTHTTFHLYLPGIVAHPRLRARKHSYFKCLNRAFEQTLNTLKTIISVHWTQCSMSALNTVLLVSTARTLWMQSSSSWSISSTFAVHDSMQESEPQFILSFSVYFTLILFSRICNWRKLRSAFYSKRWEKKRICKRQTYFEICWIREERSRSWSWSRERKSF